MNARLSNWWRVEEIVSECLANPSRTVAPAADIALALRNARLIAPDPPSPITEDVTLWQTGIAGWATFGVSQSGDGVSITVHPDGTWSTP